MTALTTDRLTPRRTGLDLSVPIAAATRIFAGSIVCLTTGALAVKGAPGATLKSLGVAIENVDNSAGAAGDLQVPIQRGCWRFANSAAADLIALADYGTTCYVVDDQTVGKTSGGSTRCVAGIVRDVEPGGVWVEF